MNNDTTTADRNLLSDKEFNYVKDFLSWELLAMKKYKDTAQNCQDQDIVNLANQHGLQHQQRYENLLTFLQPVTK